MMLQFRLVTSGLKAESTIFEKLDRPHGLRNSVWFELAGVYRCFTFARVRVSSRCEKFVGFEVVADEPDPVAAGYDEGGSDGVGILVDLPCYTHLQCTCFESMWRKRYL